MIPSPTRVSAAPPTDGTDSAVATYTHLHRTRQRRYDGRDHRPLPIRLDVDPANSAIRADAMDFEDGRTMHVRDNGEGER